MIEVDGLRFPESGDECHAFAVELAPKAVGQLTWHETFVLAAIASESLGNEIDDGLSIGAEAKCAALEASRALQRLLSCTIAFGMLRANGFDPRAANAALDAQKGGAR